MLSRLSLKYRIALVIFLLEGIMMAAVLWQTLNLTLSTTRRLMDATEQLSLSLLQDLSLNALVTEEYNELQSYMSEFARNPQVLQIMLADHRDIVVVSTRAALLGSEFPIFNEHHHRYWRVRDIRDPTGKLGALAIQFSSEVLVRTTREAKELGISLALAGMAVIALVGVTAGFFLTRKLEVLTQTARTFASGDLRVRASLSGGDELAAMGQAFDEMAMKISRELTERKLAEEALQEAKNLLEVRVQERTRKLRTTNKQLLQQIAERQQAEAELRAAQVDLLRSQKMATLGQLTATVSHELRNPLGAMRTSLFTIQQRVKDNGLGIERPLERIERSVTRCDNIITDLLDYSRSSQPNLEAAEVDAWLAEVLAEQSAPAWVQIDLEWCAGGLILPLDKDRLRRAVINVFENALDAVEARHGKEGGEAAGRLTVSSRKNGERLEISVTDNGAGIAPEIYPRIFEPLFSSKTFGVGLGLPTVKHIMEQHRGGIDVATQPGAGTTVILWLPLADVRQMAQSPMTERVQ